VHATRSERLLLLWTLSFGWLGYLLTTAILVGLSWLTEGLCEAPVECRETPTVSIVLWLAAGALLACATFVVLALRKSSDALLRWTAGSLTGAVVLAASAAAIG
jgi:hypothetical protein